jgi:succinate dehydrogenase/fumarate reductase flavoprotein subunit
MAEPAGDPKTASGSSLGLSIAAMRDLMWRSVGLFRAHASLRDAVAQLENACARESRIAGAAAVPTAEDWRRFNMLTVARLIARAALRREESRGGHFRADFPSRDDLHWKVHLVDVRPD